jgi:hypothetical protein
MAIIDFYDRGWGIDPAGVAYIQGERSYTSYRTKNISLK